MARKKRKFTKNKRGTMVTIDIVTLTCYECNLTREFNRDGKGIRGLLDREARGWYTMYTGIALCPIHTILSGTNLRHLYPLAETIYGEPEARQEALEQYMESTRRRMERASWKSVTSDDSTT